MINGSFVFGMDGDDRKKFEPLWDLVIRARRAGMMLPVLETILAEFGRRSGGASRADSNGVPSASSPAPLANGIIPLLPRD